MTEILGAVVGVGVVLLFAWLIRRDSKRAVESALDAMDAKITRLREEALARVQKEFYEEDKTLDSTSPSDKFDWLFKDHHTD